MMLCVTAFCVSDVDYRVAEEKVRDIANVDVVVGDDVVKRCAHGGDARLCEALEVGDERVDFDLCVSGAGTGGLEVAELGLDLVEGAAEAVAEVLAGYDNSTYVVEAILDEGAAGLFEGILDHGVSHGVRCGVILGELPGGVAEGIHECAVL